MRGFRDRRGLQSSVNTVPVQFEEFPFVFFLTGTVCGGFARQEEVWRAGKTHLSQMLILEVTV